MAGIVYLVGAGCGGPELITLRGRELLERCDAVVYDALVARELVAFAPLEAERIPVGKRGGSRSPKQAEINALLVEKAAAGKMVVRLKGGDPFVFGRGGEEAAALAEAGIPYAVVPGISSALAIPLEAGIPVTHRGLSRGVHILTAHGAEGALPEDLDFPRLAALEGTLVFLMGFHALDRLEAALLEAGKAPDTPAAVLSGGNAPHPVEARGTLSGIAALAGEVGMQPPAVLVVGPVAGLDLRSPQIPALTAGLTGTEEFQQKLAPLLERRGLVPVAVQRTRCTPLPTPIPWTELPGTCLAFTSARGVEGFFRRLTDEGMDLRRLADCRFAVIGSATAAALSAHGIQADLCPEVYTKKALAETLLGALPPGTGVVLFDSKKGGGAVVESLAQEGVSCRRVPLYDTIYETLPPPKRPPRFLLFGSAGAVHALADSGYRLDEDTLPVCIGPVCAAACEQRFRRAPVLPKTITAEAMAEAVVQGLIPAPPG